MVYALTWLLIFGSVIWGDEPELHSPDEDFAEHLYGSDMVEFGGERFPRLRHPIKVSVNPDKVWPSRRDAIDSGNPKAWWARVVGAFKRDPHCEPKGEGKGKLLHQRDGLSIVELDAPLPGCPQRRVVMQAGRVKALTGTVPDCGGTGLRAESLEKITAEYMQSPRDRVSGQYSKHGAELDAYLKCHTTSQGFRKYELAYRDAIEIAGKAFQLEKKDGKVRPLEDSDSKDGDTYVDSYFLNPTIIKCNTLMESRFDAGAKSETGAEGLVQQVQINIDDTRCMVFGGCADTPKRAWAARLIDSYNEKVEQALKGNKIAWKILTTRADGSSCKPLTSKNPQNLDPNCPLHSLAASALHQVKNEISITSILPEDWDPLERATAIGTAHNAGIGNMQKGLKATNGSPDQWLQKTLENAKENRQQSRRPEIKGYATGVKRCLKPNDFTGPTAKEAGVDCRKKLGVAPESIR